MSPSVRPTRSTQAASVPAGRLCLGGGGDPSRKDFYYTASDKEMSTFLVLEVTGPSGFRRTLATGAAPDPLHFV